ncbi:MAG: chemotaxis protein CheA [Geobacteraceae bacterium]|nr:chemotaxis protein CheA [Geobacteraceae bacterium]
MTDSRESLDTATRDFLAEAEDILEQMSVDLLALGDASDKDEYNPETINSIFRSAHSLKGLAGMFGFSEIAGLAHTLESLLDCLRLGKIPLDGPTMAVLFDSLEALGSILRSVGTASACPIELSPVLERINGCIAGSRKESAVTAPEELGVPENILNALTEYEEHRLRENISRGKNLFLFHASYSLDTFDRELGELMDLLKGAGEVISTLPSADGDLGSSIAFDILFGSGREVDVSATLSGLQGVSVIPLAGTLREEHPVLDAGRSAPSEARLVETPSADGDAGGLSVRSMSRTMRVDIAKLDELMNIVGELLLYHGTIAGVSDRMRDQGFSGLAVELGKAAKGMERKLNELRNRVMNVRMIPVGQLFERMSRIVRKISREQGKKIELRMSGTDTELDKMIVEDIADPLMHIIRNAIDHGIESPEERRASGKDETGIIRLSSFQKGNHVVIEVEDDGRGMDPDRIAEKAKELGLIDSTEGLSAKEILELILLPGFSTADRLSDVSGRGVGMDVVMNNIAAVSGTVDIESRLGQGSRMIITLPITLAIIKALLVETSGRTYAVPITSVRETISLEEVALRTVERKEVMQLRESTLPLLRLERFFELSPGTGGSCSSFAVVVGETERRVAIAVDDLLGQQDIVIKSLGDTFKDVRGIAGAADLGDQRTILILDVSGIITEATRGAA